MSGEEVVSTSPFSCKSKMRTSIGLSQGREGRETADSRDKIVKIKMEVFL